MKSVLTCIVILLIVGCADTTPEQVRTTLDNVMYAAQAGNVAGTVRVTLNGQSEAGLKEGVYLNSPGTRLDADLQFRFDHPAATQPAPADVDADPADSASHEKLD